MSYGGPNNPYGPAESGQPGYGYPAAPPVGPYGGAPVMTTMPGTVSAGRVLLWIIVPLNLLGVGLFAFLAGKVQSTKAGSLDDEASFEKFKEYSTGALWAIVCSRCSGRCSRPCWR